MENETIKWIYTTPEDFKGIFDSQKKWNETLGYLIGIILSENNEDKLICSSEIFAIISDLDNFTEVDGEFFIEYLGKKCKVTKTDNFPAKRMEIGVNEIEVSFVDFFCNRLSKEKIITGSIVGEAIEKCLRDMVKSGIAGSKKQNHVMLEEFEDLLSEDFGEYSKEVMDYMCKNEELTTEFMNKYKNNLNWDLIVKYQTLSEDFMEENIIELSDKKHVFSFLIYQSVSEDFIKKHINVLDLYLIGIGQKMSIDFIEENAEAMGWKNISKYQHLTEGFIEKYEKKVSWKDIFEKQKLSDEFVEKHLEKLNWSWISENKNLSEEFKDKLKTRVYNFNLPDDLREYLKEKSELNKSNISQEIINLILEDFRNNKKEYKGTIDDYCLIPEFASEVEKIKNKFSINNLAIKGDDLDKDIVKQFELFKKFFGEYRLTNNVLDGLIKYGKVFVRTQFYKNKGLISIQNMDNEEISNGVMDGCDVFLLDNCLILNDYDVAYFEIDYDFLLNYKIGNIEKDYDKIISLIEEEILLKFEQMFKNNLFFLGEKSVDFELTFNSDKTVVGKKKAISSSKFEHGLCKEVFYLGDGDLKNIDLDFYSSVDIFHGEDLIVKKGGRIPFYCSPQTWVDFQFENGYANVVLDFRPNNLLSKDFDVKKLNDGKNPFEKYSKIEITPIYKIKKT